MPPGAQKQELQFVVAVGHTWASVQVRGAPGLQTDPPAWLLTKEEEGKEPKDRPRPRHQYSAQVSGPHFFPGGVFFEKQIPRPAASEHMQIRAAWVFSISCRHLHSRVCPSTSGQGGQDGFIRDES